MYQITKAILTAAMVINSLSEISHCPTQRDTRDSAIAEEPRDALCQLKYHGRFLTELLTRTLSVEIV